MKKRSRSVALIALLTILIGLPTLNAFWADGSIPVSTAVENQMYHHSDPDGSGGILTTWTDGRNGFDYDVYAQKIDASGSAMWTADGVAVCTESTDQYHSRVVSDGEGGAIITWGDNRSGSDIYAQRIDANGIPRWTPGGIVICSATGNQEDPEIVSDGAGGAIIAWKDARAGYRDIYIQRVNASGSILWALGGMAVQTLNDYVNDFGMVSDGAGGAVIAWSDNRLSNYDIYAQRVNDSGIAQWTVNGEAVCLETSVQFDVEIVSDGSGGAIIAWLDSRTVSYNIYANRIDGFGSVLWTANGEPVGAGAFWAYEAKIIPDGAGGAIIGWYDDRNGNYDVFVQKFNPSGLALWAANGIPVASGPIEQQNLDVVGDDAGGAYIAWRHTGSDYDIYAQRIDYNGAGQWLTGGIPVTTQPGHQGSVDLVPSGSGDVILVWQDSGGADVDLFAKHLDRHGRTGYLPPVIASVTDIPGDQGGSVNVTWDATPYDHISSDITEYTLWRSLDAPAAMGLIESGASLLPDGEKIPSAEKIYGGDPVLREGELFGTASYWMLISTTAAYRLEGYSAVAPTLFDSTAISDKYHYFQVIAHTSDPSQFWISEPDSGYSVDNLAPCPPLALAGEQSYAPEGLELTWAPNSEPDFDCYHIYRDVGPSFDPSPGNLLAEQCDTLAFDGGWSWDSGYCYKVAAVDVHGNESDYAVLCIEQVTGDDPMPVPDATFLAQNYPNPFNPNTTIAFGLQSAGFVNLSVYDAAGRLVATLINESRPAGQYATVWNGNTGNGSPAASGVYFYKLVTKEFAKTRKMILLK